MGDSLFQFIMDSLHLGLIGFPTVYNGFSQLDNHVKESKYIVKNLSIIVDSKKYKC